MIAWPWLFAALAVGLLIGAGAMVYVWFEVEG